jgi:G:T/U-mismatch repair DNA glycosylase
MNGSLPSDVEILLERPGPGPHRTTILVDGAAVETLADLPPLRDRLLFVGLNPSPVSVEAGHYFQGRLGQLFWRRLMIAAILPPETPIEAADDALVAAGHGVTDLLKVPSPRDEASDAPLRSGVGPLWQKVAIWRPAFGSIKPRVCSALLAASKSGERASLSLAGMGTAGGGFGGFAVIKSTIIAMKIPLSYASILLLASAPLVIQQIQIHKIRAELANLQSAAAPFEEAGNANIVGAGSTFTGDELARLKREEAERASLREEAGRIEEGEASLAENVVLFADDL